MRRLCGEWVAELTENKTKPASRDSAELGKKYQNSVLPKLLRWSHALRFNPFGLRGRLVLLSWLDLFNFYLFVKNNPVLCDVSHSQR